MMSASRQPTSHSNASEDVLSINVESISSLKEQDQHNNASLSDPRDLLTQSSSYSAGSSNRLLETPFEIEKFGLLEKLHKLDRTFSELTEKLRYGNQILHKKLKETED